MVARVMSLNKLPMVNGKDQRRKCSTKAWGCYGLMKAHTYLIQGCSGKIGNGHEMRDAFETLNLSFSDYAEDSCSSLIPSGHLFLYRLSQLKIFTSS